MLLDVLCAPISLMDECYSLPIVERFLYHRGMKKAKPARRQPARALKTSALRKNATTRSAGRRKASPKSKTARKGKAAPQTVDQYIATAPASARSVLLEIRAAIRSVVPPEATEIISYKIPAFKHKRVLVWYAAFAGHYSLFPTAAIIEEFKDDLEGYRTSKGTIHFPADKPLPIALIKKMVKVRLARSDVQAQRC